jgi:hypothetical protein
LILPLEPSDQSTTTERPRWLLWVVLIGLVLRFAVGAFLLPDRMKPERDHYTFDYEVGTLAGSLAAGHGFSDPYPFFGHSGPSALMPPVYPLALAGIFKVFGAYSLASALIALFLNSLLSALTAIPIYHLASQCFSSPIAKWSAWLWVVFPYSVYWASVFPWATTLTTLLLTTLILHALHLVRSSGPRPWLWFGLLWGFAALADPVILSTFPFIGLWVCYRRAAGGRPWFFPATLSAIVFFAVLAPWVIRNFKVFHQPVFIRDGFWLSFYAGNTGRSVHWSDDSADPSQNPAEFREMARAGELPYVAEKREQSLFFVREHPGLFAQRIVRRFGYFWTGFWSLRREYLDQEPLDLANIPLSSACTVLALLGLWKFFKERRPERWLFALVWLSFPCAYYVTRPLLRYRTPLDPEILILSVFAGISWQESRRARAHRDAGIVSST